MRQQPMAHVNFQHNDCVEIRCLIECQDNLTQNENSLIAE
ncbi:Uncharacterised protein [Legionella hackeliae]|nr:Uncharacterised protein [Legionella hackeliae]